MSVSDKLTYLANTKSAIKSAIEGKGVIVPSNTSFREYADYISDISGGGYKCVDVSDDNSYHAEGLSIQHTFTVKTKGIYLAFGGGCSGNHSITSTGTTVSTKNFNGTDSGHTRNIEVRLFNCNVGDTITLDISADTNSTSAGIYLIAGCNNATFVDSSFTVDNTSTLAIERNTPLLFLAYDIGLQGHRSNTINSLSGNVITDCVKSRGVGNDDYLIVVSNSASDISLSAYGWSHGASLVICYELS